SDSAGAIHIANPSTNVTGTGCEVSSNRALIGGGIYVDAAHGSIVNTLVVGDATANGSGGLDARAAAAAITHTTFVGNVTKGSGGAFVLDNVTATIVNTIVWGNRGGSNSGMGLASGSTPTVSYSDFQQVVTGTGMLDADPLFLRAPTFWDRVDSDS